MKSSLVSFLLLLLLLLFFVIGQCEELPGGGHVQGDIYKRNIPKKMFKWFKGKLSRKKSKKNKSKSLNTVSENEQSGFGDIPETLENLNDNEENNLVIPEEDPTKDWKQWIDNEDAGSGIQNENGNRNANIPEDWKMWTQYEKAGSGTPKKTPKGWNVWKDRQDTSRKRKGKRPRDWNRWKS